MLQLAEGLRVVDADSHMTERHDLFTERAPKGYEDKVPHVEHIDGQDMWVVEGKSSARPALAARSITRGRSTPSSIRRAARGASATCTRRPGIQKSGSA